MDFTIPVDHRELIKQWIIKVKVILIVAGALGTVTKRYSTVTGGLRKKRMCGNHPKYSIMKID